MKYQFFEGYKYFVTYKLYRPNKILRVDEKEIILDCLLSVSNKRMVDVEAFSILNNHIHLLLNSVVQGEKDFLRELAGYSSFKINRLNGDKGRLWEKYFAWGIFDDDCYNNVLAYILGNPIRHGVVDDFKQLVDYKYCNYRDFVEEFGNERAEQLVLSVLNLKDFLDDELVRKKLMDIVSIPSLKRGVR